MMRFMLKNSYLMGLQKQVLLIDVQEAWIKPHLIQKCVSSCLGIQNYQPYEGTEQELMKTNKFRGVMPGLRQYHFFALPTALVRISPLKPQYYYLYYLLSTSQPTSSITLQTFNFLNGNTQPPNENSQQRFVCSIAGTKLVIKQSDQIVPGVNVLGLDFLMSSRQYRLHSSFYTHSTTLQLL